MSTTAPQTRHTVTALIVAHDGAQLLPALVKALNAQTYQVERTVGVDTGSRDRSGAVLGELIGQDAVFGMNRSTGYGEAVEVALRHATRLGTVTTDPGITRVEWIWLLHDDCEPAPDALEKLLRAASRDRSVVVVGPKVLDAQDRRTLREAGVSIDRAGRRVTGIDPGEIDQGQHDHKRAVLAVGSAGMLVRRDVWERLGGFDPALRFFRDDVDFCWRVQAVGLRVQVVTDAILYHRELGARRRRPVDGGRARRLDRRNALWVLAVNLPLLTMLRVVGGSIVGSLFRAGYFLLTKQLDLSAAYAFSVLGLFAHPIKLIKGRSRRAAGMAEGYYAVRDFIPPARTLFRLAEKIAGLVSNGPPQASYGRHQATVEDSEEDEQFVDETSVVRRIIAHPGVQLFIGLLIIALVAERRLLAATPLGGGALVPAWGGASALWQEYLAGFHAVSVGSTASAPPYLAVVAALGTVLGGQAWLAVDVLLLGCVPLAGLTAYVATRWLVTRTSARVLLAVSYALLPVATGAVAAGRLGTAVAFALLPLIAVSAGRMLTAAPRQARRAAWATGLLIAVAAAFAPLTWVVGLALAVGAVAARRWLVAVHPVNAAIVVATPFFVLFPWSLHLLTSPSTFLTEAGVSTSALTTRGLSPTALLALSPGGPGLPPIWVTIGLGLALLALVLPVRRTAFVIAGWSVAIVGILFAVLVSRVTVTSEAGGQAAAGWPGVAMALAALGLLLAAAPVAQWLVEIIHNDGGRLATATSSPSVVHARSKRLLACVALAAAATAPLLVAGYWIKDGVRGPVGTISAPLLPAFVSAGAASGEQYRTLILRPDGTGVDYLVVRQGDPTLGEPELGVASTAGSALSRQVAALGALNGADAGDPGLVLGSFGIRWVLLPAPVDPVLAQRLDASLGLVALNKGASYDLWQVTGTVGRARVVAADGTTTELSSGPVNMTSVSAPASGGTLILAEPFGGWTATLNGQALKPVATPVGGWAQGFVLPAGGGQLSVTRDNLARTVSLVLELIATLAIILLALPGKRADPVQEAEALATLREARDGKRAASSARRATRGERAGGLGLLAVGGVDLRGFARRRRVGQADGEPMSDEELAGQSAEGQPHPQDQETADQGATERVPVTAAVGDTESVRPGAATALLADRGQGRHRGRAEDDRRGGAQLPGQRVSTPESPVSGTRMSETPARRDTGPQRPPWEAGPAGPEAPSTGVQPRYPWESGPQQQPVAPTGSQSAARTGSHPVSRTGAQPTSGTGPQRISWTGPQPVPGSGAYPVAPTGAQPVAPTGAQPVAPTSAQPASRTGAQPTAPTGSHPVSSSGSQPAPGTGPQRVSWERPEPVPGTGGQPVSGTGAQRRPQHGSQYGSQRGPETVRQPVERAPWESADWDQRLGAVLGDRDPRGPAPESEFEPEPDHEHGPAQGRGTGASPTTAPSSRQETRASRQETRPARQEKGAHRAAKHGKPSRWRGNRSSGGGES